MGPRRWAFKATYDPTNTWSLDASSMLLGTIDVAAGDTEMLWVPRRDPLDKRAVAVVY